MGLTFDEICIDAHDATALGVWWAKVLGWPHDIDDDGDVVLQPPPGAGPKWIFLAVPDEKVVKNRIHLDFKPDDQQAEVERLIDMGATRVDIGQGEQSWVVLADPEGNEFCILR
ncbi:glyoxalase [Mycobacteriaceae bacterium 1482268.1]|nr:glyoxalase [Mycobacteriaceae bacterium 1482268.1]